MVECTESSLLKSLQSAGSSMKQRLHQSKGLVNQQSINFQINTSKGIFSDSSTRFSKQNRQDHHSWSHQSWSFSCQNDRNVAWNEMQHSSLFCPSHAKSVSFSERFFSHFTSHQPWRDRRLTFLRFGAMLYTLRSITVVVVWRLSEDRKWHKMNVYRLFCLVAFFTRSGRVHEKLNWCCHLVNNKSIILAVLWWALLQSRARQLKYLPLTVQSTIKFWASLMFYVVPTVGWNCYRWFILLHQRRRRGEHYAGGYSVAWPAPLSKCDADCTKCDWFILRL